MKRAVAIPDSDDTVRQVDLRIAPNLSAAKRPMPTGGAAWCGETYYDRPALKAAPWGHLVSGYMFVAGLGGAAQMIGAVARQSRSRNPDGVVRDARLIGAVSVLAGAAMLIADLRTPQRWYNMLRIFRPTSPMSIGSYLLTTFGAATSVGVADEVLRGRTAAGRRVMQAAPAAQTVAGITGAGLGIYTASLLGATSSPGWTENPRRMAARFASSSFASGAAALALTARMRGRLPTARRLELLACLGVLTHAAAGRVPGEKSPTTAEQRAPAKTTGSGTAALLLTVVPLACYGLGRATSPRRERLMSATGSFALLAGAFLSRNDALEDGKRGSRDARRYFAQAQPKASNRSDAGQ
ncbi:MAG: NrfD/PsrC family molybdoenzyme membrane anchor subunit [Hyphomicrobiaceae bacterium]